MYLFYFLGHSFDNWRRQSSDLSRIKNTSKGADNLGKTCAFAEYYTHCVRPGQKFSFMHSYQLLKQIWEEKIATYCKHSQGMAKHNQNHKVKAERKRTHHTSA